MLAVDTNILVHAHRRDYPTHGAAKKAIRSLTAKRWGIPWPCVHEFLAVVTNPRIFKDPTPLDRALAQARAWLEHRSCRALGESEDHLGHLEALALAAAVQGARVHDARVAAICVAHGVTELWTVDRDFGRFKGVRTHNPLLG